MRAIKVFFDEVETDRLGGIVEKLNDFPDTSAVLCGANEIFASAMGQCAMQYIKSLLEVNFRGAYTIENVK